MSVANSGWTALAALGLLACNNPGPAESSSTQADAPATQTQATAQDTESTAAKAEGMPAAAASTNAAGAQAGASAQPAQTSAASTAAAPTEQRTSSHEFHTDPVPEGYQRFEPPAIPVDSGGSNDWAQWVGGPLDQDYDVIDIRGVQSIGGHHALVYASTVAERPGTTRLWREEDQITSRLMGGIGGEGGANVQFPPGVVFRVKKGSYILIQTHYLNATDGPIVGRTVMDMKLEPVDPSRTVASMMSSTSTSITLPPHAQSSMDIECKTEKDLKFLQISNHMHDYGTAQMTDYVDPDGVTHVLKDDKTWAGELALNPNFTKFDVDHPALVPKGSTIRTHCTWDNTTDKEIKFPNEMCVFFGFILNLNDIYCTDGKWNESKSFAAEDSSGAPSDADAMNGSTETAGAAGSMAGGAAAGASGGPAPSTGSTSEAFGCTSMADQAIMNSDKFDKQSTDCATPCGLDPDVASCTQPCFEKDVGLSPACAKCNATNIACGAKACLSACLTDSASSACRSCVMTNCDPAFRKCTGT